MINIARRRVMGSSKDEVIVFADANVKALCVANWGGATGGSTNVPGIADEMTYKQAAAVTGIGTVFKGDTTIVSFDELQYFTKVKRIENTAFSGCSNLESITLRSDFTYLGASAFYNCAKLLTIDLPNVTSISQYAFSGCTALTGIIIPSTVTSLANSVFSSCQSLGTITIPSSVTSIGSAVFSGCKLTSITFNEGLESLGNLAIDGNNFTEIVFPNSLKTIGANAVRNCSSLTTVTIGTGITSIGNTAFNNDLNLTSLTIKATTPPTIGTTILRVSNNCIIYVPAASVSAYQTAWSEYASRIQAIPT